MRTIGLLLRVCTLACLTAASSPTVAAENYPTHPVRILVPFAPGGGTDLITRALADIISSEWKSTIVIENRPGGGTTIATLSALSAPADAAMVTNTRRPTFSWAGVAGAAHYQVWINISRTDYDFTASGNLLDLYTKHFRPGCQGSIVRINNVTGILQAVEAGLGIGVVPDYVAADHPNLVPVLPEVPAPSFDVHLVYADALRQSKRVAAFRDFLVKGSKDWQY